MFVAIFDPAHRMIHLQRKRCKRDLLGHETVLAPEAAAHIRSDDANPMLGHPERQ